MAIQVNRQGNCTADLRGTGLGDCLRQYGDLLSIGVVQKGWSLNLASGTLDESTYRTLIQNRTVNPLLRIDNFEQTTPDTTRATGNTELLTDVRKGKPQYTFQYWDGYCFHTNAYDLDGQNRWDILFFFETGLFAATNVGETELKAFDNGLFSVDTFKFQQGGDANMTMIMIQFNNPIELNTRGRFLSWDSLGFDANLINGVINADLSYNTVPTATTTVEVAVTDDCNRDVNVLGLADPNSWNLGGTQATSTTISGVTYNTAGYYVLTVAPTLASGDTVQPSLADVSDSLDVAENASGDFYTGIAPLATI